MVRHRLVEACAIALVLLFISAWTFASVADAALSSAYVDDDFTAGSAGGHTFGLDAFATIQEALAAVDAGGTVHVAAGTYTGIIEVTKSVTILGPNAGVKPVSGVARNPEATLTVDGGFRLQQNVTNVVIDGFEFTSTSGITTGHERAAILLAPGQNGGNAAPFNTFSSVTIQNNWFHALPTRAVFKDCFAAFHGLTVANNLMEGIVDPDGDISAIKVQSRCEDGAPSTGLTITGNVIDGVGYAAIIADDIAGVTITNNTIADAPEHGINLGSGREHTADVTITGNRISDAGIDGSGAIRIKDGAFGGTVLVRGNALLDSRRGVLVEQATGTIEISGNAIAGNDVGLEAEVPVTATNNWWGCEGVPGDAGCDTVAGTVDTSSPLTAQIASVSAPPSVAFELASVTPSVSLVNPTGVTTSFAGNSNLLVGTNTITVTSTLTIAGVTVSTDTATVTVSRGAEVLVEPAPTPTATPLPTEPVEEPVVEVVAEETSEPASADAPATTAVEAPDGSSARVEAPPAALPEGATLSAGAIADLDALTAQAPPPPEVEVALAFVLEATDAEGEPITDGFAQPIALEFDVPAESVPPDATPETLVLAFWNGSEWVEVEGEVTLNPDGSYRINASVDHFTIFAVQHQPNRGRFLAPPEVEGITLVQWGGGGYDLLDTALATGDGLWATLDGRLLGYRVGAPGFVNRGFVEQFATLPAGMGLLVVR